jgi:glyoxylase-like metal-dependent hydrolase (beta-lactamase superfamily II)
MGDFVVERQFGEAAVALISEGTTMARLDRLLDVPLADVQAAVPDATDDGRVELAFTVALVRLGAALVLIDGGLGTPKPDLEATLTPGLDGGLRSLGVGPDEITHVVLTHAHWDHVDGALVDRDGRREPRFPKARYLIGRADYEVGLAGTHPHPLCQAHLAALRDAGVLDLVDGDHVVAPGITMLAAPGETPGHSAVLVESGGATFMHLADLYHHPVELERGWVQERTDAAMVARSRERILGEAVRRGAIVASSHGRLPGWSRVVRTANGYAVAPV